MRFTAILIKGIIADRYADDSFGLTIPKDFIRIYNTAKHCWDIDMLVANVERGEKSPLDIVRVLSET